jgi:ATP-dependent RNA helicase DHX36
VHSEAKKYGFSSKSFGKGDNRAVKVFKQKRQHANHKELAYSFAPRKETVSHIKRYFDKFPPSEEEVAALLEECQTTADGRNMLSSSYSLTGRKKPDGKSKKAKLDGRSGSKRAIDATCDEVAERHLAWVQAMNARGKAMLDSRQKLPISSHREEIIRSIESNQVILIAGETGCGKTTQVPQYILEDSWGKGKPCRIMCTQPRRLSATSVADRIAQERMERIGSKESSVGYTIRLDKKGGSETPIMFVTNGIMLRMLTAKEDGSRDQSELESITHIVIDEIHERDRFADFMLIIIRDLLPRYPHLRVILMSATLHEELFSSYFGGCPIVKVPGFTFPVKEFFLEDILRVTGYEKAALQELERELGEARLDFGMLSPEVSADLSEVIESAFRRGSDEDFERMVELTGAADTDTVDDQNARVNYRHPETGATPLFSACFRGRGDIASLLISQGADPLIKAENGMTAADCAEQFGHADLAKLLHMHVESQVSHGDIANAALALSHYQSNTDLDEVDIGLIEELLLYVCGEKDPCSNTADFRLVDSAVSAVDQHANAILIFLPGWDEITRLRDALTQSRTFGNPGKYLVLPLHSMISQSEQRKVFERPPKNIRKIILSTNIAETSITIDDVAMIIDSGKQKEKSFDPYTGIATLQSGWVSKASSRQRKGRAGRCREGMAFRLYSRQRYEAMEEYQAPELMRTPLDEMVLQVKLFETDQGQGANGSKHSIKIADFLSKAPEPPVPKAVESAVSLLENIGALEERTENLTLLGQHLAGLPIPPMLGKMLLYGVLFQCLDPLLTIACCLAYRDPWVLPASTEGRRRAAQVKQDMSSKGSGFSDHLATVVAFNQWKYKERSGDPWSWSNQNFLNNATMKMIDGMRQQLLGELMSRGFIGSLEEASRNASKPDIVRSVIAAGLYPNYGRVATNHANERNPKAAMVKNTGERVRIHASSANVCLRNPVNDQMDLGRPTLLVYDELTRGDNLIYVKTSTEVNPHPIIMCSSHLNLKGEADDLNGENTDTQDGITLDAPLLQNVQDGASFWQAFDGIQGTATLTVDGWIKLRMPATNAVLLALLRLRLVSAFAFRASHPRANLSPHLDQAVRLITNIFGCDGRKFSSSGAYLFTSFPVSGTSESRSGADGRHKRCHHQRSTNNRRERREERRAPRGS